MQDILEQTILQIDKENYIANMMINTLFSNDVNTSECYRILEIVKEKIFSMS